MRQATLTSLKKLVNVSSFKEFSFLPSIEFRFVYMHISVLFSR